MRRRHTAEGQIIDVRECVGFKEPLDLALLICFARRRFVSVPGAGFASRAGWVSCRRTVRVYVPPGGRA
jgi:hypothetical protein